MVIIPSSELIITSWRWCRFVVVPRRTSASYRRHLLQKLPTPSRLPIAVLPRCISRHCALAEVPLCNMGRDLTQRGPWLTGLSAALALQLLTGAAAQPQGEAAGGWGCRSPGLAGRTSPPSLPPPLAQPSATTAACRHAVQSERLGWAGHCSGDPCVHNRGPARWMQLHRLGYQVGAPASGVCKNCIRCAQLH